MSAAAASRSHEPVGLTHNVVKQTPEMINPAIKSCSLVLSGKRDCVHGTYLVMHELV